MYGLNYIIYTMMDSYRIGFERCTDTEIFPHELQLNQKQEVLPRRQTKFSCSIFKNIVVYMQKKATTSISIVKFTVGKSTMYLYASIFF